ncbi:hypothetical protein GW17_00009431 [Ensete ventricosum]|nr:hypothetical protein GW17_00009431 [Ensete ventricosum]
MRTHERASGYESDRRARALAPFYLPRPVDGRESRRMTPLTSRCGALRLSCSPAPTLGRPTLLLLLLRLQSRQTQRPREATGAETVVVDTGPRGFPVVPETVPRSLPFFLPFASPLSLSLSLSLSGNGGGEAEEPVRSVEHRQALRQWRRLRYACHLRHPTHRYGEGKP